MKIVLYFLLCTASVAVAQHPTKTNLVAGTSLTYLPVEGRHPLWNDLVLNHEFSWTLSLGFQFHPIYRLSLQNTFLWFDVPTRPLQTANIIGLTHQFNVLPFTDYRFYGEVGAHLGNYCSCAGQLSQTDATKLYLSLGVGGNIWLNPKLDLEVGLHLYHMVDAPEQFMGYTRYVLGLNYYFRKRQPKKKGGL